MESRNGAPSLGDSSTTFGTTLSGRTLKASPTKEFSLSSSLKSNDLFSPSSARLSNDAEAPGSPSVLSQLKQNMVSQSAEIMVLRSKVDHVTRERDRLSAQVNELQLANASLSRDAKSATSANEEVLKLRTLVSKYQTECADVTSRYTTARDELNRERTSNASLSSQLQTVSNELQETKLTSANRLHEAERQLAQLNKALNDTRAQSASLLRDRDDLEQRLKSSQATNDRLENELSQLRKELSDTQTSLREQTRLYEEKVHSLTANSNSLARGRQEAAAQLEALQATNASLHEKSEELRAARAHAEAELNRRQGSLDALSSDLERISQRWKDAEARAAEAEATIMQFKSQVNDLTTQLQLSQGRLSQLQNSANVAAAARAASNEGTDAASKERKLLRQFEDERESIADLLASIVPLPSFVRERVNELESGGTQRFGQTLHASLSPSASSSATNASREGEKSPYGYLIGQLRDIVADRPVVIEALTTLDRQVVVLRAEKERLSTSLDASKKNESSLESALSSTQRQLQAVRAELQQASEARDALSARVTRAESEVKARTAEYAHLKEILEAEKDSVENSQCALADARAQLSVSRDEVEALQLRISTLTQDYEHQLTLEKSLSESLRQAHASQVLDLEDARRRETGALNEQLGQAQDDLHRLRQEGSETQFRLSQTTAELDRTKQDIVALTSRIVQLELALSQSEAACGDLRSRLAETDAARTEEKGRADGLLAQVDTLTSQIGQFSTDVTELNHRLDELAEVETRNAQLEAKVQSLTKNTLQLESRVAQLLGEVESLRSKNQSITEQANQDRLLGQQATNAVVEELQRVMAAREADSLQFSDTLDEKLKGYNLLNSELAGVREELSSQRERARRLQQDIAQSAQEVLQHREESRHWHDQYVSASAELQAERDRHAAVQRATMDQLEAIKRDFNSFLSLFHSQGQALGSTGSFSSFDLGSSQRVGVDAATSAPSNTLASSSHSNSLTHSSVLASSISAEMNDLKRRLESLSASQKGASLNNDFLSSSYRSPRKF